MPAPNRFRHQQYVANCPQVDWQQVHPDAVPELDSAAFSTTLARQGRQLAAANVGTIYLVHGTLAGTDLSGLIGELGRLVPEWADQLRDQEKRLVDSLVGDWGNYDDDFAETLRNGINADLDHPIEVRRYFWASENHHVGRADGAVRLISALRDRHLESGERAAGKRILLWGHSHAGNVFALVTNLLGATPADRQAFFRATRSFYRWPGSGSIDLPEWDTVRRWLAESGNPLANRPLDFVTFGTPIRYGWDRGGYSRLMHFIHHRPQPGFPPYLVPFPPSLEQLTNAECGDMIQQVFVAGTNFPPNLLAWRSWLAEQRLGHLLQPNLRRRNLWERLKIGMRVPDEGHTILVDYVAGDALSARSMLGHAVYTKRRWLPFHLAQMVAHLYEEETESSRSKETQRG